MVPIGTMKTDGDPRTARLVYGRFLKDRRFNRRLGMTNYLSQMLLRPLKNTTGGSISPEDAELITELEGKSYEDMKEFVWSKLVEAGAIREKYGSFASWANRRLNYIPSFQNTRVKPAAPRIS